MKEQKTARCPRSIFALLFSDNLFPESSANMLPLRGFTAYEEAKNRSLPSLNFCTPFF